MPVQPVRGFVGFMVAWRAAVPKTLTWPKSRIFLRAVAFLQPTARHLPWRAAVSKRHMKSLIKNFPSSMVFPSFRFPFLLLHQAAAAALQYQRMSLVARKFIVTKLWHSCLKEAAWYISCACLLALFFCTKWLYFSKTNNA